MCFCIPLVLSARNCKWKCYADRCLSATLALTISNAERKRDGSGGSVQAPRRATKCPPAFGQPWHSGTASNRVGATISHRLGLEPPWICRGRDRMTSTIYCHQHFASSASLCQGSLWPWPSSDCGRSAPWMAPMLAGPSFVGVIMTLATSRSRPLRPARGTNCFFFFLYHKSTYIIIKNSNAHRMPRIRHVIISFTILNW